MQLTTAEEEVMKGIWDLGKCTVSRLIDYLYPEDKPPHSSVSTIVRILEKKGYLSHNTYGRTYEYYPMVDKETYAQNSIDKLKKNYFKGSSKALLSFLIDTEEDIDIATLSQLLDKLKNQEND